LISRGRSYQSSEISRRKLHLFASEVLEQITRTCLLVRHPAIDALVDSFHYRLHLLVLHGGESLNPSMSRQRHKEHFVLPARAQVTLTDTLLIGLDVPSDFPLLPDMKRAIFSHGGSSDVDAVVMEMCSRVGEDRDFLRQSDPESAQTSRRRESQPFQSDNGSGREPARQATCPRRGG
jgi:hypothetical protein